MLAIFAIPSRGIYACIASERVSIMCSEDMTLPAGHRLALSPSRQARSPSLSLTLSLALSLTRSLSLYLFPLCLYRPNSFQQLESGSDMRGFMLHAIVAD